MADLDKLLTSHGLCDLGRCAVTTDEDGFNGTLVMIGPDEPAFWDVFDASDECRDGEPDALDRWSKRVLTDIAGSIGAEAVFPFGGPPYHPFFTWALRTGRFWSSPIHFLVHADRGLFASFRGALVLPEVHQASPALARPCDTCAGEPCRTACPVDAFASGYDVAACKGYLVSDAGADCMTRGCAARRACPIGQGRRRPEQASFHMKAFL